MIHTELPGLKLPQTNLIESTFKKRNIKKGH